MAKASPAKKAKAPAKAKTPAAPKASGAFNLLERGTKFTDAMRESMLRLQESEKKNPLGTMGTLGWHDRVVIPIPEFGLQYALNTRGFVGGTLFDIIAPDGVGKTTLCFTLLGWGMYCNCPGAYIETEGKKMLTERILRCLHSDPRIAQKMFDVLYKTSAFDLKSMILQIREYLVHLRDPNNGAGYVPINYPAMIAVDTFSKLMSPSEMQTFANYMKSPEQKAKEKAPKKPGEKKEKIKEGREIGGGSNMEHAKIAAQWCRELPFLLNRFNAFLVVARHQNDKIDMAAGFGGGSVISAEVKEMYNRTSLGGRAFNQNSAYQIILAPDKTEKADIGGVPTTVSRNVRVTVTKNSFGPPRKTMFRISLVPRTDTELYQEPALDFGPGVFDALKQSALIKVTGQDGNIGCDTLGVRGGKVADLAAALRARTDVSEDLGRRLKFAGYGPEFKVPVSPYIPAPPPPAPAAAAQTESESEEPAEEPSGAENQ